MIKTYQFKTRYGTIEEIYLILSKYVINQSPAITMNCSDDHSPYGSATTNLGVKLNPLEICVDTNNLGVGIVKFLQENNIATSTGQYFPSGYCTYPVMKINEEWFKENSRKRNKAWENDWSVEE